MSDKLFGLDQYFYHGSVRRYVALFGTLFTDIYIQRQSKLDDGSIKEETIKVPIRYGNGNMYLKVPQDDTREVKQVARVLPAMAFEIANIYKDVSRKTNATNRIQGSTFDAAGKKAFQFNRVPYNFIFDLNIRTKNSDDMLQIIEQIIPAFDANLSVTIQDTTGVAVEQDIIIALDELSIEDNFDNEMQSRLLEYKLTFELKGYLYKRTQNSIVMKEVDIQGAYDDGTIFDSDTITDQPPITEEQNILSKLTSAVDDIPSFSE